MDSKLEIEIPKPCFESWEEMRPSSTGKFCGSCLTNVVDFTNKSAKEIKHYFIENSGNRVCGRFETRQLNSITIQVPQQILLNQVHFRKIFLLALLLAMGTTLFSCADNQGNKQKIEKVEIVEQEIDDTLQTTLGMLLPPHSSDSVVKGKVVAPPEPTSKVDEVKFVKPPVKNNTELPSETKSQFKKPPEVITTIGIVALKPKDSLKKTKN